MLTTNNPYHKTVAQYGGDHNEGEGQGPEHVQVAPGGGGVIRPRHKDRVTVAVAVIAVQMFVSRAGGMRPPHHIFYV